jgi:hypothetical protein
MLTLLSRHGYHRNISTKAGRRPLRPNQTLRQNHTARLCAMCFAHFITQVSATFRSTDGVGPHMVASLPGACSVLAERFPPRRAER